MSRGLGEEQGGWGSWSEMSVGEGSGKQNRRGNGRGRLCTPSHRKTSDFSSERKKKPLDSVEWKKILI